MSRIFRVRLPHDLDEQLTQMCEATRLPVSAAIRACVEFVLANPEAWQIFQRALPYSAVDTRTPQQQEAFVAYERQMQAFDMGTICREQGLV
jgi:Ribbon-helix-helix protein, copG family